MMRPIGIFDSGFGGLTVFNAIQQHLPQYDYYYLGDSARAPYGGRSFETVYEYTLACVKWLYEQGCPLVILACNTASAKALRSIQQNDLPAMDPQFRVLGVIRPTAEVIGQFSNSGSIGILATQGTVNSKSYEIEIEHYYPELKVAQQACPLWVPFIENNAHQDDAIDAYIQKDVAQLLAKDTTMDVVLMACTHYPIIQDRIQKFLPEGIKLLGQGELVAQSLEDYLQRHAALAANITKGGTQHFYTTDDANNFEQGANIFLGNKIKAKKIHL